MQYTKIIESMQMRFNPCEISLNETSENSANIEKL